MRIVVDSNRWQSYARCVFATHTVLRMYGRESVEYDYNPN
jgi:IS4 transposase